MNTAKQALLAAGRIKEIKQGRISNDNHVWLLEQVASGVKFSDYPKGGKVVVSTTDKESKTTYVKPAPPAEDGIATLRPFRYDEKKFHAVPVGKTIYGIKSFGLREVCRCKNSLVACYCDQPVIHANVRVEVVPRP